MAKTSEHSLETLPDVALEVADDAGKTLLVMPRGHVLRQKLRHKAVLVCLRNIHGHIYLFKSPTALPGTRGDVWAPAVFGRVQAGESRYTAAQRLLETELGIRDLALFEKGTFTPEMTEQAGNVIVTVFITVKTSAIPRLAGHDTQDDMFVDREEFRAIMRDYPHMLAPFWNRAVSYFFSS